MPNYSESNYIRDKRILEHGPEGWSHFSLRHGAYFKGKRKWFADEWRHREAIYTSAFRSREDIENLVAMYELTKNK